MNANTVDAPFAFPIRIYWEDTDAGGIVFYANYLKFFERARTEWLRSLGVQQQALREATGGMFVVIETSLKYHRPARLDDQLLVTAKIKEIGRAGMTLLQSALCIQEQTDLIEPTLLCEGSIRIGWVDAHTLRPARIPPAVIDALASTQPR
jgi:acyl-CoA thioester hydrolase